MTGIKNLDRLLKSMKPELVDGEYVFCTLKNKEARKLLEEALLYYKENEGITLIVKKEVADSEKISYSCTWALITLTVHSNLEAVGFIARISNKLADNGISVNVISAYYHDHLFVPFRKAKKTMELLEEFSK